VLRQIGPKCGFSAFYEESTCREDTAWLTTQSGPNPSLPANLEMQGDFDKMQGAVSVNPAKIRRISAAWTGLSLLQEQGGLSC
jgi:hypothetical protein